MSELTDFIKYCNLNFGGKLFTEILNKLYADFIKEQESKKKKQLKGVNQPCFYPCLNDEYIYPCKEETSIKAKRVTTDDDDVEIVVVTLLQP